MTHGEDKITTPKTEKSNRTITMPDFLTEEVEEYIDSLDGIGRKDRIFAFTKDYLHHEMNRGAKQAGVKRISSRYQAQCYPDKNSLIVFFLKLYRKIFKANEQESLR